jgi:hypothetical protein
MRKTPISLAIAYLCAGVVFLAFMWGVVVIYSNSQVNREALNRTDETLRTIKSCTTPGKKCFNEGQARTGEAVAGINEVAVMAAACADKPRQQTVEQIERCVRKRLAEKEG